MTVDVDMSKLPVLEAGFMVMGVVMDEGCVVVAASPPDFCVGEGSFFFLDQRGQ